MLRNSGLEVYQSISLSIIFECDDKLSIRPAGSDTLSKDKNCVVERP